MTTRAAIYARISRDKAETEIGVQDQEADCRAFAAANGHDVVAVFVDNDTSATKNVPRPSFDALVRLVRSGGVDVVLVRHVDRLYRRLADLEAIIEPFHAAGVAIVPVQSSRIDLATADGRLNARLLGSVATHESEVKAERVSAHARNRALRGRGTSSERPFGWCRDAAGQLVPHPTEGPAVAEAFARFLDGESLSGIARWLQGQGFTATGGGPMRQGGVSRIMRSPRHAGLVSYKGQIVAESADGLRVVDRETFDRVQAILLDPVRKPTRGRLRSTLLSGVARCAVCGRPMVAGTNGGRDGVRYPTYDCMPHRHVSRARADLDGLMRDAVGAWLQANVDTLAAQLSHGDPGAAEATQRLNALREQQEGLSALVASMQLTPKMYALAAGKIEAEIAELEARRLQTAAEPLVAEVLGSDDVAAAWGRLSDNAARALLLALGIALEVPPRRGAPRIVWPVQIAPPVHA